MDANCQLNWVPGEVAGPIQPTVRAPRDQQKSVLIANWLQSLDILAANTFSAVDTPDSCATWGRVRKGSGDQGQTRQIDFLCAPPGNVDDCFVDRVMGAQVKTDHRPLVLRLTGVCRIIRRRKKAACIVAWAPDETWGEQVNGVQVDFVSNWEGIIKAIQDSALANCIRSKHNVRIEQTTLYRNLKAAFKKRGK